MLYIYVCFRLHQASELHDRGRPCAHRCGHQVAIAAAVVKVKALVGPPAEPVIPASVDGKVLVSVSDLAQIIAAVLCVCGGAKFIEYVTLTVALRAAHLRGDRCRSGRR